MASTSGASGVAVIGIDDGNGLSGADTIFGFNGADHIAPAASRSGPSGDAFLDDTGGIFDAALGYALAYQSLLAQAWKNAPSLILQHLDWGGSCAPAESAEADGTALGPLSQSAAIIAAANADLGDPALAGADSRLAAADDSDGDIAFADAGVGGGDFFGMT